MQTMVNNIQDNTHGEATNQFCPHTIVRPLYTSQGERGGGAWIWYGPATAAAQLFTARHGTWNHGPPSYHYGPYGTAWRGDQSAYSHGFKGNLELFFFFSGIGFL